MEEEKSQGEHEHHHKEQSEHKQEHPEQEEKFHGEHHARENETITINKLTVWKSISTILAVLLIIAIFTGGFGFGRGNQEAQPAQAAQPAQPRQAAPTANQPAAPVDMRALSDDDDVKGDKSAPVTIVEFSDFECPFCTRFYQQTLPDIKKQYIDTGKVKLVYRDYPLTFHPNAQKAAESAECAGEQDKFWEMHDKLFDKGVNGGVESFKQFASDIGIDIAKFNGCLDSGKMADEVAKDFQDGQAAGISGTPGFIINGNLVSGAQPFSVFQQVIEAELAK